MTDKIQDALQESTIVLAALDLSVKWELSDEVKKNIHEALEKNKQALAAIKSGEVAVLPRELMVAVVKSHSCVSCPLIDFCLDNKDHKWGSCVEAVEAYLTEQEE